MAVDKNLFLYDFAIVAMMGYEGRYIKEWLDYYLLAGVDHFYIYDHESPDNQKEVMQPYIDAGIITYIYFPGAANQMEAYNDAVKKFKFFCRYMAFIDGDEFLLPLSNRSITEVVDEILADKPNVGGLQIRWYVFGSNFQDNADYSHGVKERFTRRGKLEHTTKTITNPRKINFMNTPHFAHYFEGIFGLDDNVIANFPDINYKIADKIVINHYYTKSREEFINKIKRGNTSYTDINYKLEEFSHDKNNDEFDDRILKYCSARQLVGGGIGSKQIDYIRVSNALVQNLFPTMLKNTALDFYVGKLETFLTCRALSSYLKENFFEESVGRNFEEYSLNALYKAMFTNVTIAELRLLLKELPKILPLDYPVVEDIRKGTVKLVLSLRDMYAAQAKLAGKWMIWKEFTEWDYLMDLIDSFKLVDE